MRRQWAVPDLDALTPYGIYNENVKKPKAGGGWQAVFYALRKGREVGTLRLWRAMRSKNACKTCALGMGGQLGGMVNEKGHFPEVCKKSLQAMAADMRGRIEPRFFETYSIRDLRSLSPRELEMAGRIVEPVVLRPGESHYKSVSWDDALALVSAQLKASGPDRTFFYSSGRSSNEAGFLLHLLARALGTNNVANCSFYCHQASGVGLRNSIGTTTATVELEDLDKCDLLFLIGGNPASNHPRFMTSLMNLRKRGGKVIVINPLREPGLVNFRVPSSTRSLLFGSEIASLYLQPRIGGDIALLTGISKALLESGQIDLSFVKSATEGFEEALALLESLSWEEVEHNSGVAKTEIEQTARIYAESKRAIFSWTMGITHHEHGVQNVQWIANLALLRGMIGKPGAGLLPIRGHSNVQGLGSIGLSPALSRAAIERLETIGLKPSPKPGNDPLAALEAAHRGEMDFGFSLGGNLYGASPDAAFVSESMSRLKSLVYVSTTLNTGHAHGLGQTTLILPALVRDEETQSTTQESMFNYVRLSDGGERRHDGPKSEIEILAEIGLQTLGVNGPLDWSALKNHDEIRSLIARLVPGFEELESIGRTKQEFHIPGRVFHEQSFPTPNGRASFRAHPLPTLPDKKPGQVQLMTIRSEGQFNTIVYEEEDLYRGQDRRNIILMNPDDILEFGLDEGQVVSVESDGGKMDRILVRPFEIARGCAAMYYPEANALVSRTADPLSRTPAFKSVLVTIEKSNGVPHEMQDASELEHVSASKARMKSC